MNALRCFYVMLCTILFKHCTVCLQEDLSLFGFQFFEILRRWAFPECLFWINFGKRKLFKIMAFDFATRLLWDPADKGSLSLAAWLSWVKVSEGRKTPEAVLQDQGATSRVVGLEEHGKSVHSSGDHKSGQTDSGVKCDSHRQRKQTSLREK